jgi:hypothetical protein
MIDNYRAVELLEQAERDTPTCACGLHTLPVAREGGVWLACASQVEPKGPFRRLVTLDFAGGHTDRQIIDLGELEAA